MRLHTPYNSELSNITTDAYLIMSIGRELHLEVSMSCMYFPDSTVDTLHIIIDVFMEQRNIGYK